MYTLTDKNGVKFECPKLHRNISLQGGDSLTRVDLSNSVFDGANLVGTFFHNDTVLENINFNDCNLRGSQFLSTRIEGCVFNDCNLANTSMHSVSIQHVNLNSCKLVYSSIYNSTLLHFYLRNTDLNNYCINNTRVRNSTMTDCTLDSFNAFSSDFFKCDFKNVDFGGVGLDKSTFGSSTFRDCKHFFNPRMYLSQFKKTRSGIYVYKAIGKTTYSPNPNWVIKPGSYLEEVANPNIFDLCGCGVNFATKEWLDDKYPESDLWLCLIEWDDVPSIIVPFNTDGKARCNRLKLVKIVDHAPRDLK